MYHPRNRHDLQSQQEALLSDATWELAKAVPLDPGKAVEMAAGWARKWARETRLVRVEIVALDSFSSDLAGHYCFVVHLWSSDRFHAPYEISVVVLMNGSLIEPKPGGEK